jgi:UDP-glucuronate decarboxylase
MTRRYFSRKRILVTGLVRLMHNPEKSDRPDQLGYSREFSMAELAELVIGATGSKSELVFAPLSQDDPRQRQPDISLAKELLVWKPTIALQEGVKRTINYLKTVV